MMRFRTFLWEHCGLRAFRTNSRMPNSAGVLLEDTASGRFLICHATPWEARAPYPAPIRPPPLDEKWSVPKGMQEANERLAVTAARELREETGIELPPELFNPLAEPEPKADIVLFRLRKNIHMFRVAAPGLEVRFPAESLACSSLIDPPQPNQGLPELDAFDWVTREEAHRRVFPNVKQLFEPCDGANVQPKAKPKKGPPPKKAAEKHLGKVLLLHAWGQTATVFEQRTKILKKKLLAAGLTPVYAEAPHEIPPITGAAPPTDGAEEQTGDAARACGWWYYSESDRGDVSLVLPGGLRTSANPAETQPENLPFQVGVARCIGIEASLESLRRLAAEQGPFVGVIAFSQGTAMASILVKQAELEGPDSPLGSVRFALLFSGFWLQPEGMAWYDSPIQTPALHVYGLADGLVPAACTKQLASRFSAVQFMEHEGGHGVPQRADQIETYLAFITGALASS
eukprot:TRINITY_DN20969_c0_g1_i1.p1 TRINITY_DN20969_c0_g1~~TRINITY_DN20969_c0_g1_i1.p1  ORF type:complete len:458 (+),score=53.25 TRINITY_DN20969_c0_g1_i1:34-1407(+)